MKTSHPEPFLVEMDENVYRQERRWENRHAYDALVTQKGDGVLTAVFEALEANSNPMSTSAIHRQLMANGRPCSYFSVLAVLYGFKCFAVTDDHHWKLAETETAGLREGYRALGIDDKRGEIPAPLTAADLRRLTRDLRVLTSSDGGRWIAAINRLVEELDRIRRSLMERD